MKRNCPICNSESKSILFKQRFKEIQGVTFLSKYDVVVCNKCGAGFADDIPSQEEFNQYYALFSKYEKREIKEIQDFIPTTNYIEIFNYIKPYIKKEQSIVDIGCASGDLLRIFKDNGFKNIKGIDPSQQCVDYVQLAHNIIAKKSDIGHLSMEEKYDCIILSSVLEHIVDLEAVLSKLWQLLNENGVLCIDIPDGGNFSKDCDAPFQQFSTEHINYFSKISLKNLMKKYSFIEIDSKEDRIESGNIACNVVRSIYRKDSNDAFKIEKDNRTKSDLVRYIDKSNRSFEKINNVFLALAKTQEPIIVWGAGTFILCALEKSALKDCNIIALVDSNPKFAGKNSSYQILSPIEIKKYNCRILIGSFQYQEEIKNLIKYKLLFKNEVICLWTK